MEIILTNYGNCQLKKCLGVEKHFSSWTEFEYMASQEEKLQNTKGRSDMEIPWAAWNGELKINWDVTKELFGEGYVLTMEA